MIKTGFLLPLRMKMPKYDYKRELKEERVIAEKVITEIEAAELLGVDRGEVYFRVVHELTSEAPPWAVVRLQAIKRGG